MTRMDLDHRASDRLQQTSLLQRLIRVARGVEPGDFLLYGGQVVNVFTEKVESANVVIVDGSIAGVGPFAWEAKERLDLQGRLILPGLIDAHMHLESTLLTPAELARIVVPHGTATIIADPHEIANVMGTTGIELLMAASENLPLDIFFMAPSCVPAVEWEDAGATIDCLAIDRLLSDDRVLGLAEVMDFPAVLDARPEILAKILAARNRRCSIDGHAPGLLNQNLMSYVAAGIRADHESTTPEEARSKADLGMMVQVREGSNERNLDAILPLIVQGQLGDWCLATDDVLPSQLVEQGHLDGLLARVVAAGCPPATAVRHATLIPARHYGLNDRGAVAPGYRADLVVSDDLEEFRCVTVLHGGEIVARDGAYSWDSPQAAIPTENSIHLGNISAVHFAVTLPAGTCPVIEIVPDQILTRSVREVFVNDACRWHFDPRVDVALIAYVERHRATGRVGLGLVRGFGFQCAGALGSSVAHDSHNLIIVGTNPDDMYLCVRTLESQGGGFVVTHQGETLALLPLPVAGLVSASRWETVCCELDAIHRAAGRLGCKLPTPFSVLSFLALPVIPELRITTRGLFDVRQQRFVPFA